MLETSRFKQFYVNSKNTQFLVQLFVGDRITQRVMREALKSGSCAFQKEHRTIQASDFLLRNGVLTAPLPTRNADFVVLHNTIDQRICYFFGGQLHAYIGNIFPAYQCVYVRDQLWVARKTPADVQCTTYKFLHQTDLDFARMHAVQCGNTVMRGGLIGQRHYVGDNEPNTLWNVPYAFVMVARKIWLAHRVITKLHRRVTLSRFASNWKARAYRVPNGVLYVKTLQRFMSMQT